MTTFKNVLGGHLQEPVDNWVASARAFPVGSHWQFFQVENASEAMNANPYLVCIHRYWVDHQDPYLFAEDKEQAARQLFDQFIDGTFLQHAWAVQYVCELNEYFANGEDAGNRQQKIEWCRAVAKVWATEYRTRPELAHIRLVLCRTAVGNDIPLECAQIAVQYDCVLSYHGYVPVQNKVILGYGDAGIKGFAGRGYYQADRASMRDSNEPYRVSFVPTQSLSDVQDSDVAWRYFAGRWASMDDHFVSNGYKVQWVSTEGLPVGYSMDNAGNIYLHAFDGWRHNSVCRADPNNYLEICQWYAQKCFDWNRTHDNRYLGMQLFTSFRSGWQYFQTNEPELTMIGNWLSNWHPETPPDDDRARLLTQAKETQVIYPIDGGALLKAIVRDGRILLGNEFYYTWSNGTQYVCQYAYDAGMPAYRYVYKVPVGEWDNVTIEAYGEW